MNGNTFLLPKGDMFSIRWQGAQQVLPTPCGCLWRQQGCRSLGTDVILGEGEVTGKKMQLANIISSNTFKPVSFPYYLSTQGFVYILPIKQCIHFMVSSSSLSPSTPFSWFLQGTSVHKFGNWQGETSSLFCVFPPPFHRWFVTREGSISVQILFKKLP